MWFKMPLGTTSVTVQQQHFAAELTVKENGVERSLFRAPEHFAHYLTDIGFGVVQKAEVPTDAPPDLPATPMADTVGVMAGQLGAIREENERLKAEVASLSPNLDAALRRVQELETECAKLQDEVEKLTPPAPGKKQ